MSSASVSSVTNKPWPVMSLAEAHKRLTAPGERFSDRPGVRLSAIFLVAFLLALAASGLAGLPRAALTLLFGRGGSGPLPLLPFPAELALGLVEAAGNAAVQPFGLVALTVFYFDRRARREGLDLERWANSLGRPEKP